MLCKSKNPFSCDQFTVWQVQHTQIPAMLAMATRVTSDTFRQDKFNFFSLNCPKRHDTYVSHRPAACQIQLLWTTHCLQHDTPMSVICPHSAINSFFRVLDTDPFTNIFNPESLMKKQTCRFKTRREVPNSFKGMISDGNTLPQIQFFRVFRHFHKWSNPSIPNHPSFQMNLS